MSKQIKIILTAAIMIILILSAVYFIFYARQPKNTDVEQTEKQIASEKQSPALQNFLPKTTQSLESQFKQTFIAPFVEYFGKTSVEQTEVWQESGDYQALPKEENAQKEEMSDEEYFKLFYPDYYIEYLVAMEKMMADDNYIAESDKNEFVSEKNIISFLNGYIDYLADKNIITEGQKLNFKFGVNNTLPELNQKEKEARMSLSANIKKIIAKLAEIMPTTKKCRAVADCFWPGVPKPGGANLWAPCCNCGWNCGSHGCWFVPDCGVGGCMVNQGCRNGVCGYANASIWDPIGGICGCG